MQSRTAHTCHHHLPRTPVPACPAESLRQGRTTSNPEPLAVGPVARQRKSSHSRLRAKIRCPVPSNSASCSRIGVRAHRPQTPYLAVLPPIKRQGAQSCCPIRTALAPRMVPVRLRSPASGVPARCFRPLRLRPAPISSFLLWLFAH